MIHREGQGNLNDPYGSSGCLYQQIYCHVCVLFMITTMTTSWYNRRKSLTATRLTIFHNLDSPFQYTHFLWHAPLSVRFHCTPYAIVWYLPIETSFTWAWTLMYSSLANRWKHWCSKTSIELYQVKKPARFFDSLRWVRRIHQSGLTEQITWSVIVTSAVPRYPSFICMILLSKSCAALTSSRIIEMSVLA